MELKSLDLPQLIVALDSLEDDANYVHIKDVREDVTYYCPCCKGVVKPRACKKDKEYQVQPHFYHESGGCNEETYVHYICKNWLFEKGCKFIVSGIEYEVDSIKTEKTLHTSFGDYRPDIIVTTTTGKVFYFEIRTTNKKTELYAPKWDELGNDVVEVDTRYFINQKHTNDIPEFELIYSNGECFIKRYSRADYEETIAKRKLEWKRQDKLNYKMQWEKLDWFWCELQRYKEQKESTQELFETFSNLHVDDMGVCWDLVFNKSQCFKSIKDDIREIINNTVMQELINYVTILNTKYPSFKFEYCFEPKRLMSISWNSKYYLYKVYDSVCLWDSHWIVHPCNLSKIKQLFEEQEEKIKNHNDVIMKLKDYVENNHIIRNMVIFSYDLDCSHSYDYQSDFEKSKSKFINHFEQIVTDYHIDNYTIEPYEAINYIKKKFDSLFVNFLRTQSSYSYCDVYLAGRCIANFSVSSDDNAIYYNNNLLINNLDFYKKEHVYSILDNCIDLIANNISISEEYYDVISDLSMFSNKTWRFEYDLDNHAIKIILTYRTPYLNNFTLTKTASQLVEIDFQKLLNINLKDYKQEFEKILNTTLAPVMKTMLEKEILQYNLTHINSVAFSSMEVTNGK